MDFGSHISPHSCLFNIMPFCIELFNIYFVNLFGTPSMQENGEDKGMKGYCLKLDKVNNRFFNQKLAIDYFQNILIFYYKV